MINPKEDKKITIEDFKGLYSRGSVDEVPWDHAQDCLNLYFTDQGHVKTRDGLSNSLSLNFNTGVRRFFLMTAQPANDLGSSAGPIGQVGPGLLMLSTGGNFYVDNGGSPVLTMAGTTDFAALNISNRTFISPNTGSSSTRGQRLKVMNSFTNAIRDAAGLAPAQTSPMAAVQSGAAGEVPAGVHKIAVVYETDTGFWTPPGPKHSITCTPTLANPCVISTSVAHGMESGESHQIYGGSGSWSTLNDVWHVTKIDDTHFSIPVDTTGLGSVTGSWGVDAGFAPPSVTVDGVHKISLTGLPNGGAQVKRRIFLATRANENEFFFVPERFGSNSIIPNDGSTTATLDFLDTDLVSSADYLFDLLEVVPAGSSLTKYKGRLVIAGSFPDGERVLLSNVGDPESFNYVSGYAQVQSERDGNNVTNCFVLRDTLYMSKFVGLFSTQDNGDAPSTWTVSVVDGAVGCYAHGSSSFTVAQPTPDTGDIVLFASRSGLFLFDGVVRRPELTAKIQSLWLRINFATFNRVTVVNDIWNHRIYISAPLDTAVEPNTLIVGDYTDGRDPQNFKWTQFSFHKNPTCIGMSYFNTDGQYVLRMSSIDGSSAKIWGLDPTVHTDDGNLIQSYYMPGPLFIGVDKNMNTGGINVFKLLTYRVYGSGTLNHYITSLDNARVVFPPSLALASNPGRELQRQINFVNEKLNVKVGVFTANSVTAHTGDWFVLDRIDIHGMSIWAVRPSV